MAFKRMAGYAPNYWSRQIEQVTRLEISQSKEKKELKQSEHSLW